MRCVAKFCGSILVGVFSALLVAEVGARQLDPGAGAIYEADAIFGVTLRPASCGTFRSREGSMTEICTDQRGMRSEIATLATLAAPGSQAERRLLVIGDSQVLGFGVPWQQSLLPQLRAYLPNLVVDAIGVPTWGPAEYAEAARVYGKAVRATDVVIVVNATNDFEEANTVNRARTSARDGLAISARSRPRSRGVVDFFVEHSRFASAIARGLRLSRESPAIMGAKPPSPAMNLFARRDEYLRGRPGHQTRVADSVERAQRSCAAAGQRLYVVVLPADVQVDMREWDKYRGPAINPRATFALLDAVVADARAKGVPSASLLADLRSAGPGAFLADDYHLSGRGQGILARSISRLVQSASAQEHPIAQAVSGQEPQENLDPLHTGAVQ